MLSFNNGARVVAQVIILVLLIFIQILTKLISKFKKSLKIQSFDLKCIAYRHPIPGMKKRKSSLIKIYDNRLDIWGLDWISGDGVGPGNDSSIHQMPEDLDSWLCWHGQLARFRKVRIIGNFGYLERKKDPPNI